MILTLSLRSTFAQEAPANTESRNSVCVLYNGKQISANYYYAMLVKRAFAGRENSRDIVHPETRGFWQFCDR
jgi:hypothetical protein